MNIYFTGKNSNRGLKESDPTSIERTAESIGLRSVAFLNSETNLFVCVDFDSKATAQGRRATRLGIPTVLIANEPRVVIPQHGKRAVRRLFDRVIEVGRSSTLPVLKWPQTIRELNSKPNRLNRAVIVNADKWSFVEGQLYWLRAAVAQKRDDVDLFGYGWDRGSLLRAMHRAHDLLRILLAFELPNFRGLQFVLTKPKNYRGTSVDKVSAMSDYRVAIVIENSEELLTEKLFDAWFAGCIPVYVGPKVSEFGLDELLVVQCEPTVKALGQAIDEALSMDHRGFLLRLSAYLGKATTLQPWESSVAIGKILKHASELATPSARPSSPVE